MTPPDVNSRLAALEPDYVPRGLRNGGSEPAEKEENWTPPTPLGRCIPRLDFPTEALPGWIGDFVRGLSCATQTPVDLPGMLVFSALAAVAGGLARVEVRAGWREPLNIYCAVALASGSRKSAVFAEVTAPLICFEREEVQRQRRSIIAAEMSRDLAEKDAQVAKAAAGTANSTDLADLVDEAATLAERAAGIVVPPTPRLLVDDATPEALTSLLVTHGRMALMAPEGDVFDMMAGRYQSGGGPNLGVYLRAHSGDELRVDRKGRDPEYAPNPALTVGLAVQPDVLRSIANRPGFRGRGLLARFAYSVPVNTVGHREIAAAPVPAAVRDRYCTEVCALARSLVDQAEVATTAGGEEPLMLTLTPQAARLIVSFEAELEPRLAPETGDLGDIADWGGKLAGAVARIAGLLHLAGHLHTGWGEPIDEPTMTNAIAIGRYLADHALAVFDLMGADPDMEKAKIVLRWIVRKGATSFSRRNCFTEVARSRFPRVDDLDPALRVLEAHGWIRSRPRAAQGSDKGRPPSPVFDVNPGAAECAEAAER